MAGLSKTRGILEEALRLARGSSSEEALTLLESGLADARRAEDSEAVAIFARSAGIISSNVGEFQRAIGYYSEAIERQPTDAFLWIALAELHERSGEEGAARDALTKCLEIALLKEDSEILAMLRKRGLGPDPDA
jgi:tetratricopeptide (TPR) repeat protein